MYIFRGRILPAANLNIIIHHATQCGDEKHKHEALPSVCCCWELVSMETKSRWYKVCPWFHEGISALPEGAGAKYRKLSSCSLHLPSQVLFVGVCVCTHTYTLRCVALCFWWTTYIYVAPHHFPVCGRQMLIWVASVLWSLAKNYCQHKMHSTVEFLSAMWAVWYCCSYVMLSTVVRLPQDWSVAVCIISMKHDTGCYRMFPVQTTLDGFLWGDQEHYIQVRDGVNNTSSRCEQSKMKCATGY